ncbi:MAG TPA: 2-C-methyl-D-erythritol 4-phosphate cytidylyltransferase [Candidatus Tyrphobacter sp.]
MIRWAAVIAAAGRGERFGQPKQFVEIAGSPMLAWSIRAFASMREIGEIVVATEPGLVARAEATLSELAPDRAVLAIVGGGTRQESVRRGIAALGDRVDAVLVHDGARPLVRAQNVRVGMREVRPGRGAVLATPVVDTIKVVDPATMRVERTFDRTTLWAAQTPQFAMLADFRRAYATAEAATDDTTLLERIGVEVVVVPSRHANFKVTSPEDVAPAELLLRERLQSALPETGSVLVEVFAGLEVVEAICREIEAHGGRIDAIERDLPRGAVVRAYIDADRLRDFEVSFVPLADGSATLTVHDVA